MILDFIPSDATPREVAILVFYHVLQVHDPKELAKILHYKDRSTVDRKLKKFRGKVNFPFDVDIFFTGR